MINLDTAPFQRVLHRGQNHLYLAPHPALRPYVAHYTVTFPSCLPLASTSLTLLPDISGCLVFSLTNKVESRFWGATTQAVTVPADFEEEPIRFFVEFRPGGAYPLTGLPMSELTNKIFTVQEVIPALFRQMEAILEQTENLAVLLQEIDDLLLARLANGNCFSSAPLLALLNNGGAGTVRALADISGYSERHLSRIFANSIGASMKACAQVVRINNALKNLRPGVGLAALAQNAGYYDQPHFNHDFKAVCGVSPTQYLAQMSAFYKEEYKF